MRKDDGGALRSPVVLLLIALGLVFLLECILQVYAGHSLAREFGLSYPRIRDHQYWRLLTYQFLHDAPWPFHILFNSLALWFLGRTVFETVGTARFWQVYLLAGTLGGLAEVACQAWHPGYTRQLPPGLVPDVVGASASVMGLAGAFCFLHPTREIVAFIYFFPVRLRSMTLFWILLGYSIFGTVFPHGRIAHAAHLGGLLTGVLYVKLLYDEDTRAWLRRFTARRSARRSELAVPAGKTVGRAMRSSIPPEEADGPDDFIRREVDPILDKISAHGIQSLTERERRILEKARERMRSR
jgi:membrane associated rhomboid family serine protease